MEKTRENNGITVEKLSELGKPFLCIFLMNISNRLPVACSVSWRRREEKEPAIVPAVKRLLG